MHNRQAIQRIPASLSMESRERSFSPSGSWMTLSVESKSASTSSGYGTPCAGHGEDFYHRTPILCSSTSSGYLTKEDSNSGCDNLIKNIKLDPEVVNRKRPINGVKQCSDMYHQRQRDNLSPQRRLKSQQKPSADQVRLYAAVAKPQKSPSPQCGPVHRLYQQHSNQYKRKGCSFFHDRRNQECNCCDLPNSPFFSSGSSVTAIPWRDDYYSPHRVVPPPSLIYQTPSKWKSESDLRDYRRFKVDGTLDEETAEIYDELVDTAETLALMEQKARMSEARCMDDGIEPPLVPRMRKSWHNLQTVDLLMERNERTTRPPPPKPLDNRRRKWGMGRQGTPTNMASLCPPRNPSTSYNLESSTDALMTDRDEASALAALEAAVNSDLPRPSRFANGGGKSGPIQIIRDDFGETEDGCEELLPCYMKRNISPSNYSCIEIDSDDDNTEKLEPETLPRDPIITETLGTGSGSYSEFTTSEDMSCSSDLEI